ncbi:MAG: diaminopimelate epimerase [Chitinophagia bacterium]|nr:diaminopimelate epimerase [Chitinophagia bacterium]
MQFYKYQGTGNDFILINNMALECRLSANDISRLCHRRFGIGADGLMLLEPAPEGGYAFSMRYYNADGRESTFCGNGGRCITAFAAQELQLNEPEITFLASDGVHKAWLLPKDMVRLQMSDIKDIKAQDDYYIINAGSPHYIVFVSQIGKIDVLRKGSAIRYSPKYMPDGINVNFVKKISKNSISMRTYERGVEDETLSCGTGAVAAAVAFANTLGNRTIEVFTQGGILYVTFNKPSETEATDVLLTGPAVKVFEGEI